MYSVFIIQDLSSTKHRKEQKEIRTIDTGDTLVATRVFKSTTTSKKRPEKRERRSGKEEYVSGSADSGSADLKRKQNSREKKEEIRLQKRSEINEKRQKERKEKYEKKKLDARQEKKLRTTAAKAQPSDDTLSRVADAEEEGAVVARPKKYSDRRREDKIKRENRNAPVADANSDNAGKNEKLSEQFSNMSVVDNGMKGNSRAREEGMNSHEGNGKKTGKGGGNEGVKKRKEEQESLEGEEEKELTEEEKRRKEEIRARRDKERQERKERMKNKVSSSVITPFLSFGNRPTCLNFQQHTCTPS